MLFQLKAVQIYLILMPGTFFDLFFGKKKIISRLSAVTEQLSKSGCLLLCKYGADLTHSHVILKKSCTSNSPDWLWLTYLAGWHLIDGSTT